MSRLHSRMRKLDNRLCGAQQIITLEIGDPTKDAVIDAFLKSIGIKVGPNDLIVCLRDITAVRLQPGEVRLLRAHDNNMDEAHHSQKQANEAV